MKISIPGHTAFLAFVIICLASNSLAAQPPALGPPQPPLPGVVNSEIGNFIIINMLKNTIQTNIDTINARISRQSGSTGVKAHLSFTSKVFKPGMSTTTLPDQPNQNVVRIAFMIEYNITDISYHSIPYFSRKLSQSITVIVSCKNWFAPPGTINITAVIEKPYPDDASFAEQVLNFFIANTLTGMVDSNLRQTLPNAFSITSTVPNSACSCLGVDAGQEPTYTNGAIKYAYKKIFKPMGTTTALNNVTITLKSIKRLPARDGSGQVLYAAKEDIQVEFYANQTLRSATLSQVADGEERVLNVPVITISKPANDGMVVLIGNILQTGTFQKDTRFVVFNRNGNFGNGTQKLIVQKSYWQRPQRLPGGGMTKPLEMKVNAYELTVQINVSSQAMGISN